jgi:hypothetical protein
LFQLYKFYAFHAAAVKDARLSSSRGNSAPASPGVVPPVPPSAAAVLASEARFDEKLLTARAFVQLLRDFRLVPAAAGTDVAAAVPWLDAFVDAPPGGLIAGVDAEVTLTYREFLRCLLRVGEERYGHEKGAGALLKVLEQMDMSEQVCCCPSLIRSPLP